MDTDRISAAQEIDRLRGVSVSDIKINDKDIGDIEGVQMTNNIGEQINRQIGSLLKCWRMSTES